MRRFVKSRWWAFVLTLCVLLASSLSLASRSYGDANDPFLISDGNGGGTSLPSGDPDGPAGPTKRSPAGNGVSPGGHRFAATPVGDGGTAVHVWSWRFHVVLRSLISRWLRL
jgi:hypothetical protein